MKIDEKVNKSLQILKLNKKYILKDIEESFRKLAVKYHPDRCQEENKSKCREKFIEINNARKFLEDYYMGKYKSVNTEVDEKKLEEYKEYIDHIKRFYDGWIGDLDF